MKVSFGELKKDFTGPLYDGTQVRQGFVAQGSKLISVSVYCATYKRKNHGTMYVEVLDRSLRSVAKTLIQTDLLEDNSFREFGLKCDLVEGANYELRIFTKNCRSGQAPTVTHGVAGQNVGFLFIGSKLIQHRELSCIFKYEGKQVEVRSKSSQLPEDRPEPPILEGSIRGLISVVVPHYNCQDFLDICLLSLSQQSYQCFEVIIVDDGSKDVGLTERVVEKYRNLLPSLRFLPSSLNLGAPAARNLGASLSIGEYLFFCDSDVRLYPQAFDILIGSLLQHLDADFVYGGFIWGNERVLPRDFDLERLRATNYVTTMSLLRRAKFPGWDEDLKRHQDWDLWLTVAERGGKGVCCGRYLFDSPVRVGSISSGGSINVKESRNIIRKKHGLPIWEVG